MYTQRNCDRSCDVPAKGERVSDELVAFLKHFLYKKRETKKSRSFLYFLGGIERYLDLMCIGIKTSSVAKVADKPNSNVRLRATSNSTT